MNADRITAKAQMLIHKAPAEVFDAFAEPASMSKFWFTRHDDGLEKGQTVYWHIGSAAEAPKIEVQVKELEKPRTLVIDWGVGGVFTRFGGLSSKGNPLPPL